jgi:hypothetical protein
MVRIVKARSGGQPFCFCGCPYSTHQHFRPGTDCGACDDCTAYRPRLPRRAQSKR